MLPAFKQMPEVVINLSGAHLTPGQLPGLSNVRVQQRLSMPSLCELTFLLPPGAPPHLDALVPGTPLQVSAGAMKPPLFDGAITAVEYVYTPDAARELIVRGYDRLHAMRQGQHLRSFSQVTAAEVAQLVAADYGLTVEAEPSAVMWPMLFQHHQSDLELLVEICARIGQHLSLRGSTLHLISAAGTGDTMRLALGEDLLEAHLELNADPARARVSASGWDAGRAAYHTEEAARGPGPVPMHGGQGLLPAEATAYLVNEGLLDGPQAYFLAQADMDFRQASEAIVSGVAAGNPALQPGTPVEIAAVVPMLAGRYTLTAVTHVMNNRLGFISEISSRPLPLRPRLRGTSATLGVVSNVRDPNSSGRVKVRLPSYGSVESDWMTVLAPGAGAKKGLVMIPAVGDTVLVLLLHEDPGQGVILGGLYGTQRGPDSGVDNRGEVHRFTWSTPGGQHVLLDDSEQTIHLENAGGALGAGSQIDVSGDRITLRNRAGSFIQIEGDDIVIAGKSVDFRSL